MGAKLKRVGKKLLFLNEFLLYSGHNTMYGHVVTVEC